MSSIVLSKDHSRIFSVSHDACGKIYNLVHKQQVRRIADFGEMSLSSCVVVCQDSMASDSSNTLMIVGSWDNKIYTYSVEYGRVIDTVNAHDDAVTRLCFSSNGCGYLLSSSWDATVKLWQCTPHGINAVPLANFADHEHAVESVQFDSSGNIFATGGAEGDLILYDVRAKKSICSIYGAHNDAITQIAFADSGTLISSSKDQYIKLSKINGAVISSFNAKEPVNCFVSDGDMVITGGDSGLLKMWQVDTGDLFKTYPGHTAAITSLAVATHGQSLVSGAKDGEVISWTAD